MCLSYTNGTLSNRYPRDYCFDLEMLDRETNSDDTTQRALLVALGLNTVVCFIEFTAGYHGNSLALVLDAFHNCSDEIALILLILSYSTWHAKSRTLKTGANHLNTLGIALVAALIVYFSLCRMLAPVSVEGSLTMGAALAAALGNQLVALSLRKYANHNPAIALAYIHNIGDVAVCLSIALSGAMIHFTHSVWLDPLLAFAIAGFLLVSTAREWRLSRSNLTSYTSHPDQDEPARSVTIPRVESGQA